METKNKHGNGRPKLTDDDRALIIILDQKDLSQTEISKKIGCSQGVVSSVLCKHREDSRRITGMHPALLLTVA